MNYWQQKVEIESCAFFSPKGEALLYLFNKKWGFGTGRV